MRDLHTHFFLRRGVVKAVDGVSFTLRRGEVLGLVGESGCGKSLTALSLMRLLPKGGARTIKGEVLLDGENILERCRRRDARHPRAPDLDDPAGPADLAQSGVHDRRSVARGDPAPHSAAPRAEVTKEAVAALRRVEIAAPEQRIAQYPAPDERRHEAARGRRHRDQPASPAVLIADEPTTALDVTIQLQYLKLLKRLQPETGMAILFITHDFGVVGAHVRPRGGDVRRPHRRMRAGRGRSSRRRRIPTRGR